MNNTLTQAIRKHAPSWEKQKLNTAWSKLGHTQNLDNWKLIVYEAFGTLDKPNRYVFKHNNGILIKVIYI